MIIKDDMFRPSCGHHQVYSRDTEIYEELRTYMGSQWLHMYRMTLYKMIPKIKLMSISTEEASWASSVWFV